MYTMKSYVRYSEADSDGLITPDSLVNYLQDCTMLHSESVGRGVTNLRNAQGFWLLAAWQIQIVRTPKVFEKITVTTNPYKFKGFFGSRNFEILNDEGEQLVRADSTWVYLDAKTHTPARVPKEEGDAYGAAEPRLEMEYAPRKIKLPDNLCEYPCVPVRPHQIDTNQHVNNCEYIRTFMEVTDTNRMPYQIRAEYKQSAVLGDTFHPFVYKDDKICVADLRGDDGTPYAAVEFIF